MASASSASWSVSSGPAGAAGARRPLQSPACKHSLPRRRWNRRLRRPWRVRRRKQPQVAPTLDLPRSRRRVAAADPITLQTPHGEQEDDPRAIGPPSNSQMRAAAAGPVAPPAAPIAPQQQQQQGQLCVEHNEVCTPRRASSKHATDSPRQRPSQPYVAQIAGRQAEERLRSGAVCKGMPTSEIPIVSRQGRPSIAPAGRGGGGGAPLAPPG